MKPSIRLIMYYDSSNHSGIINKFYDTITILDSFDVLAEVMARNIDKSRILNPDSICFVPFRDGLFSDISACLHILLNKSDFTYMQLTFDTFFFIRFLCAKLSGSKILLYMEDPLYEVIKLMPTEVLHRVKLKLFASIVEFISKYTEIIMLLLADYIFVTSQKMKSNYLRMFPKKNNIYVLYNNVPSKSQKPKDKTFDLLRNKFNYIFLYLGMIQPNIRGYEKLLDIFSKIKKKDRCLLFIGPDLSHGAFKDLVTKYALSDYVIHIPPVKKEYAMWYLTQADFFVLGYPSPDYILPNKFFDSYHANLPMLLPWNLADAKKLFDGWVIAYSSDVDLLEKFENIESYSLSKKKLDIPTYQKSIERLFTEKLGLKKNP
ncbi:MAG: hypothetical protein ABH842_05545 [Candidatus Micrarchaeota archaeon]